MTHRRRPPRLVAATRDDLLDQADFTDRLEAMLAAGLPAVLVRDDRGGGDPARLKRLAGILGRCRRHGAELWVGDRVDLARAVGADRVHLPERGLSIAGARAVAPGIQVGRSVHGLDAAVGAARMGADHLVVGTIFASPSHRGIEPAGPGFLRAIAAALGEGSPPLLAIGGLTPERVGEVRAAGAHGVVAIGALWEAADPPTAVERFLDALEIASRGAAPRR